MHDNKNEYFRNIIQLKPFKLKFCQRAAVWKKKIQDGYTLKEKKKQRN